MAVVQFICAKIGMVSGEGLGGVLGKNFSKKIVYPAVLALLVANTINAGADIGAIAAAVSLLAPIPIGILIIPITVVILAVQLWGSYRVIASIFKWLAFSLLAYIGAAFFAHPDIRQVLYGTFVPEFRWDSKFLSVLVAILGTTISPYLFFWQSSQEVEEQIANGRDRLGQRKGATQHELRDAAWDVNLGMLFSNVVMYFIIMAPRCDIFQSRSNTHRVRSTGGRGSSSCCGKIRRGSVCRGFDRVRDAGCSDSRRIKRVNGLGINIVGWLTTAVMCGAAIELVLTWKL